MARDLHYFALEFGVSGVVARHHFTCATDAEEGAQLCARLSGGSVAFQQWGDPDTGLWDDPVVLLEVGLFPEDWMRPFTDAA
ncbi:hypothetical protein GCM10009434_08280 [Brevundimonas olei]